VLAEGDELCAASQVPRMEHGRAPLSSAILLLPVHGAFGDNGSIFRGERDWRTPMLAGRAHPKTLNAPYQLSRGAGWRRAVHRDGVGAVRSGRTWRRVARPQRFPP
jgi:hypothetical protein